MWSNRVVRLTDKIPPFNDYLVEDFRSDKIDNIPVVLEMLFNQAIHVIDKYLDDDKPRLIYKGYRECTPDERDLKVRNANGYGKNYNIRKSLSRKLEFIFEFMDVKYIMDVNVPYVHNYAVTIDGIPFYPLFVIVDKGGMYRTNTQVILQVSRAKLRFTRAASVKFMTVEGGTFSESSITAKLHMAKRGKDKNHAPIILHHLSTHGLLESLKFFGVDKSISINNECVTKKGYQNIKVKDDVFIHIHTKTFKKREQRFVIGLLQIFKKWNHFGYDDIFDARYYLYAVGKWEYPNEARPKMIYGHALTFTKMNESIIDPGSMAQHNSVGIHYDNLDELLLQIFDNIDNIIYDYTQNSTNLFDRKLGVAEQMLSSIVHRFNTKLFNQMINTKEGVRPDTVKRLMYQQGYAKWIKNTNMFRGAPEIYNDNYLLAIGKSKFRTASNAEISSDRTGSDSIGLDLLKADPSTLAVESPCFFPSSKPVQAGSLNVFVDVNPNTGELLEPAFIDELKNVYKI